jgi:hypothetical protein
MAIYESQEELWIIPFTLLGLVYPIWYILLIVLADKDPQVDPVEVAKKESPYS